MKTFRLYKTVLMFTDKAKGQWRELFQPIGTVKARTPEEALLHGKIMHPKIAVLSVDAFPEPEYLKPAFERK